MSAGSDREPPLDGVLDGLPVGIFVVDTDWTIRAFNAEAERITGFSRSEALGRKCYDVFVTRYCNEKCFLQRAMRDGGRRISARLNILRRDDRATPVEISAAALRDETGRVIGGVESFLDVTDKRELEKALARDQGFGDFLGRDPAIAALKETLILAVSAGAPILFLGETGTGKDLLARMSHNAGPRAKGPFVKINCAALPEQLLESELFGYRKGAFTDARKDKPGMFDLARGGTIFFDEIGELPQKLQAKLLQVIEDREFYPLGATAPQSTDVQVMAATNRDLDALVAEGGFRPDLYFRLRVIEARIPPLRRRQGDLALLIEHFLTRFAARHLRAAASVSPAAMRVLLAHDYPGNARELMHVIEHAVILCRGASLEPTDLPQYLRESARPESAPSESPLMERQRECLLEELARHDWNMSKTAKALGVDRSTLWRKMKKHGL